MSPEVRVPAVAGRFYPGQAAELAAELRRLAPPASRRVEPAKAIACIAPHAGYVYSGSVAAETYARVDVPLRVIVICPNHTGMGTRRAVWADGQWLVPGGAASVDSELAAELIDEASLNEDRVAHLSEHAIEVHVPLLQQRRADVRLVPICLGLLSLDECASVGSGIARVVTAYRERGDDVLVVASTDMSHYISADAARVLDQRAIDRITALDAAGLYDVVTRERITMCGFVPTTVTLFASAELGASRAELVRYSNSGETSGDYDHVVGYAGLVVT